MTRTTSFRVNDELRTALERALRKDGYNQRQQSAWICNAIKQLLIDDPRLASVGVGEGLESYRRSVAVILDDAAQDALDQAIWRVRGQDAHFEGVRGAIIRAAIRHGATHGLRDAA